MGLYDFFLHSTYKEQEIHLANERRRRKITRRRGVRIRRRVEQLEQDLGFVCLVLGSMIERIEQHGAVTRADLRSTLEQLDGTDGAKDGKLDVDILRDLTFVNTPIDTIPAEVLEEIPPST